MGRLLIDGEGKDTLELSRFLESLKNSVCNFTGYMTFVKSLILSKLGFSLLVMRDSATPKM